MRLVVPLPIGFACSHCGSAVGDDCVNYEEVKARRAHKNRRDKAYGATVYAQALENELNNIWQIEEGL
jgi:hypothetical protein